MRRRCRHSILALVHSEQRVRPRPFNRVDVTVTLSAFGNQSKLRENSVGGTTGGISFVSKTVLPARILQIAGWAIPRSKLVVMVLPAKLALKPSPQAGALAMLLPLMTGNHKAWSSPEVISSGLSPAPGNSVMTPLVVIRPS